MITKAFKPANDYKPEVLTIYEPTFAIDIPANLPIKLESVISNFGLI